MAEDSVTIKMLYLRYAGERVGRTFVPQAFHSQSVVFNKVTKICKTNKFDPHLYILACFHHMPKNWCLKIWNRAYPLPFTLANPSKAKQIYDDFLRFVKQYAPPEYDVKQNPQDLDLHVWNKLGHPVDKYELQRYASNGTLSKDFVEKLLKKNTGGI